MGSETSLQDPGSLWGRLAVPPMQVGKQTPFYPDLAPFWTVHVAWATAQQPLCGPLELKLCLLSPNLQFLDLEGQQSLWAGAALAGPDDPKGRRAGGLQLLASSPPDP